MRVVTWTVLGAAVMALGVGRAQQAPTPAAVTQPGTRLVSVDAVVTDKKGNSITGLTAGDFQLWEDGKEQKIVSSTFLGDIKTGALPRHVFFLFDNRNTRASDQVRAHDAAVKFASSDVGPNRLMAVASYTQGLRLIQDFTFDAQKLNQALDKVKVGHEADVAADNSANPGAAGSAGTASSNAFLQARAMLTSLTQVARSLGSLPGRKVMVIFTEGFVVGEDPAPLQALTEMCNRSNVSVYPVDLGGGMSGFSGSDVDTLASSSDSGMPTGGGNSAAPPRISPRGAMLSLAKETGGTLLIGNDIFAAVEQAVREQDQSYTLAYAAPSSSDGSCHSLRVKVNRSGTVLRARNKYCNEKSSDLLAGTPAAKRLEAKLADAAPGTAGSLRAPFFYSADNSPRVNLSLDIPSAAAGKEKGKTATLEVLAVAYKPDGAVALRVSDSLQLDKKQLDQKQGLHYEKQVALSPGSYTLKLAFSLGEETLGRAEAPLEIDPYNGKGIAISGLALSSNAVRIPKEGLGPASREDSTPLVVRGLLVTPSGTNRFKQSDMALVYIEVYHPLLTAQKPPRVGVVLRIMDKKTGAERQNSGLVEITGQGVAPEGAKMAVGLNLPLKELGPGAYVVEMSAVDSLHNRTAPRTADLTIE